MVVIAMNAVAVQVDFRQYRGQGPMMRVWEAGFNWLYGVVACHRRIGPFHLIKWCCCCLGVEGDDSS